ncbi:hypothetical protein FF011L_27680 [Roseimaritima multifibrata]|uniref:Uncharacterized protein n=1 Tax=Roseimaritima multifibrata TaxID=1930274 RepID=A0A517MGI1_9BACT|nr:hypothetical protein FF011L_27680 [Roseimaritima multifibrata]
MVAHLSNSVSKENLATLALKTNSLKTGLILNHLFAIEFN